MESNIQELKLLVSESDRLLEQDTISPEEKLSYEHECRAFFKSLKLKNINCVINEIATRGLNTRIQRIENRLLQWLYTNLFCRLTVRTDEPLILKHSNIEYFKQYVYWTKKSLEGLIFNLTPN